MLVATTSAPPLTDDLLNKYKIVINNQTGPLRETLDILLKCVEKWWGLPESKLPSIPHLLGQEFPLEENHKKELYDLIPWEDELLIHTDRINSIKDTELINVAKHLMWHVKELNRDREPITTDKVNVTKFERSHIVKTQRE